MRYTSENNPHVKLTLEQVKTIKQLIAKGIPSKDIAHDFSVNPSTISRIKRNKAWKEVKNEQISN